jgi:hypothetical protein
MVFKLKKTISENKGQSAVEFLLLIPVLVFVLVVAFQMFSIVYTSLVNQGAARFEVFRIANNLRGRAEKVNISGSVPLEDPIYPGLETYDRDFRATNNVGSVDVVSPPKKPYFAMMVEEPRGSGLFPKREIRTIGTKIVNVKTRFGLCERADGVCN